MRSSPNKPRDLRCEAEAVALLVQRGAAVSDKQNRQIQTMDRILEQSLPKPGVAEAMRFWRYTRPVPTERAGTAIHASNPASG